MQKTSAFFSQFSIVLMFIAVVVVSVIIMPIRTSAAPTAYIGTTRDLYIGVPAGEDIRNLQKVLNNDPTTKLDAPAGASGSIGFETTTFGPRAESAVQKFQTKYNIVTSGDPNTTGFGRVGHQTRAKLIEIYGQTTGITIYDYNNDGAVDKLDLFYLQDVILGDKSCPLLKVCDVNVDGQATVSDILTLVNYLKTIAPVITVATPSSVVQTGTAYTVHWATTPASIKSGINIQILKDEVVVAGQRFGRVPGNLSYDYNNDGVVDTNDKYVLIDVVLGNQNCPSGKVCDINGNGNIGIDDSLTLQNLVTQYSALLDTGSFVWNVPSDLTPGGGYKIQITAENDASTIGTSGPFTISAPLPPPPGTLTVIKIGNGTVKSSSPLGDIDCGVTCAHTYTTETNVTLEAIPDSGYRFVSFSGCVLFGSQCTVSVLSGSSRNVTATFELIPPVSATLSVNQSLLIPYNTQTTIVWSSTNATSCDIWAGTNVWDNHSTNGSQRVGPLTADTAFHLKCTGSAGTDTKDIIVTVQPPLAVSVSLNVIPSNIPSGNIATLSWSAPNAGPQAEPCIASGGWSGTKAKTGTESTGPLTADHTYTISCTGPGGTAATSTTIKIISTIVVTAPFAGAQLEQGTSATVSWTTTGSTGDDFSMIVLKNGAPVSGQSFTTTSITNPRSFTWNIPSALTAGSGYTIRVQSTANSAVQNTSSAFRVVPTPKIEVAKPSGGEIWTIGSIASPQNISWKSTGLAGSSVTVTLKRHPGDIVIGLLSPPNGISNNQGNYNTPQSNNFSWPLAEDWLVAGAGYTIQVCSRDVPTLCGESKDSFTILDEVPQITFTNMNLTPPPYTIGESVISYDVTLMNAGIRSVSGLTLAAWVEQGSAQSAVIELPLACRTQSPGTIVPGVCRSDSITQRLQIENEIGQFTQGPGKFVAEIRLGGAPLASPAKPARKEIGVYLYPSPKITLNAPNGPSSVDRFPLGKKTPPSPIVVKWKTQGLINNVVIKIKQMDPVLLYDFNNDGAVNALDGQILVDFANSNGLSACNATTQKNCDIDGDGALTQNDPIWLTSNILLADPLRYLDRVAMFDFNGDGTFDSGDVAALENTMLSAGSLSQCYAQVGKNCDVNRDGIYNVADTIYLTKILDVPPPDTTLPGASNLSNNKEQENTFQWTPEAPFVFPAGNYQIIVCDLSRPQVCDESNKTFLIYAGPPDFDTDAPTKNKEFEIKEDMSIAARAHHSLGLTEYKISLYQNDQLIYENIRDNNGLTSPMPFFINNTLIRKTDGRRVIDLLRDGPLRIVVSGQLGAGKGYTNSASRTVSLKFNRTPPNITKPTDKQEINLGKGRIEIEATHTSHPASYKVSLYQNSVLMYSNESVLGGPLGMQLSIDKNTTYNVRNVFQSLDQGEVLLVVQGKLLDGYTDEARRTFTVVPLPPDYDLNDDGYVTSADLAILQATIVYDAALRKAVDEGRATSTVKASALIEPCINPKRVKPKNCNYYPDFETSSSKRSKGMRIIDSRDAALLVSSGAYDSEKNTTLPSAISSAGAPIVISPAYAYVTSTTIVHWTTGMPQKITIQTVPGAAGYLVGFVRPNGTMIFENYRDTGSLDTADGGGNQTYTVGSKKVNGVLTADNQFNSRFSAGPLNIIVRALVNNQWTEATVVPIIIDGSSDGGGGGGTTTAPPVVSQPPSTNQPPQEVVDTTKVILISPKPGDIWIKQNPQTIVFQQFAGATAYYFKWRTNSVARGIFTTTDLAGTSFFATSPALQRQGDNLSYFVHLEILNKLEVGQVYLDVGASVNNQWTPPTNTPIQVR